MVDRELSDEQAKAFADLIMCLAGAPLEQFVSKESLRAYAEDFDQARKQENWLTWTSSDLLAELKAHVADEMEHPGHCCVNGEPDDACFCGLTRLRELVGRL